MITQTCVVFDSVDELQETNESLLRALRSVTDKADELEAKLQADNTVQLKVSLFLSVRF